MFLYIVNVTVLIAPRSNSHYMIFSFICWMFQWLIYCSSLSLLIPLFTSIAKYKRLNNELKFLTWLFIFGAIVELTIYISRGYKFHNIWIFNIFALVEAFVLFYIIGKWFNSSRMFKAAIFLFALYGLYWFYTTFITSSIFDFNSKEKTVKGILLIFLSGFLLFRLAENEEIKLISDYRLWITFAILFYFSLTLIVFTTANFLLTDHTKAMQYSWAIHSVTNIISNLLFAFGYLCYYRKTNSYI
jgi:hypothetical protein